MGQGKVLRIVGYSSKWVDGEGWVTEIKVDDQLIQKLKEQGFNLVKEEEVAAEINKAVQDRTQEIFNELLNKAFATRTIEITLKELKNWFKSDYGVEEC